MGKTVPSYRLALDEEIGRWKGFAEALRSEDKEAFEQLMDACRSYASAGSNATRPVMFEPMAMSIMLSQQKKIVKLQKALDAIQQCSCQPHEAQRLDT
jgi:2,4-dienoyl-CoA reductase-like NADH-dependent reductase (Old Yellow Enzyme family)